MDEMYAPTPCLMLQIAQNGRSKPISNSIKNIVTNNKHCKHSDLHKPVHFHQTG